MKKDKLDFFKDLVGTRALSKKEKIGPFLVVGIIFITGIFLVRPSLTNITQLRSNIKLKEAKLDQLAEKKRILESYKLQDNQLILDNNIKLISKYLPSTKPSLETLMTLIDQARTNNLQFSGLTLNPGEVKTMADEDKEIERLVKGEKLGDKKEDEEGEIPDKLESFEISFSFIGDKTDIEDFISNLREVSPMMRVQSFSTSFMEKALKFENQISFITAEVTLKVFYQDLPDKLPAFDEPLAKLTKEETRLLDEMKNYMFAQYQDESYKTVPRGSLGNTNPFNY